MDAHELRTRWHLPGTEILPAWLRPGDVEPPWAAAAVITGAIVIQILLPDTFVLRPKSLAPALEGAALLVLVAGSKVVGHDWRWRRPLMLALSGLLALSNVVSTALLVHLILVAPTLSATKMLASGAGVWLTNITAFALWYWQFDRGGVKARAEGRLDTPDFLFPQMSDQRLNPQWRPLFLDYLYVSFTNATAFSPTDTMPLSRWAKMLMLLQSGVALITISLVAARAVNVLPTG